MNWADPMIIALTFIMIRRRRRSLLRGRSDTPMTNVPAGNDRRAVQAGPAHAGRRLAPTPMEEANIFDPSAASIGRRGRQ